MSDAGESKRETGIGTDKLPHFGSRTVTSVGYKIVDKNLQSRGGFQFAVGEIATVHGELQMCVNGLHFCHEAIHCIGFSVAIEPPHRYLRVIPMSKTITDGDKSVTGDLYVEREISAADWLKQILSEFSAMSNPLCLVPSLLETGAIEGDIEMMDMMLKTGSIDLFGPQYLLAAVHSDRVSSMEFLVKNGVKNAYAAMDTAIVKGKIDAVRFLVKIMTQEQKNIALDHAALRDSVEIAAAIIDSGATMLDSALWVAARQDKLPMVRFLIERGATDIQCAACETTSMSEVFQYLTNLPSFNFEIAARLATTWGLPATANLFALRQRELERASPVAVGHKSPTQ